jgi:methyl-accepting chemotaxis protein
MAMAAAHTTARIRVAYGAASASSLDLNEAVQLHEHVKEIVRIASRVNLVAINANLVARTAGEGADGFRVVSAELRGFSVRLQDLMRDLSMQVNVLVRSVAQVLKERRYRRIMGLAHESDPRKLLEATVACMDRDIEIHTSTADSTWTTLGRLVRDAARLCRSGGDLSRNAKIEAVSGGAAAVRLSQVADDIESLVSEIQNILRSMLRELNRERG